MKVSSMREQTDDELRQLREDTARELFDLKMKKGWGGATEQPLRIRTLRRDMARINTVVRERESKENG